MGKMNGIFTSQTGQFFETNVEIQYDINISVFFQHCRLCLKLSNGILSLVGFPADALGHISRNEQVWWNGINTGCPKHMLFSSSLNSSAAPPLLVSGTLTVELKVFS